MSLPAAQQQTLDKIADGLRGSAPKLAAMYGIFTRLCSADALPRREQLDGSRGWRDLLAAGSHRSSRPTGRGRRGSRWALLALCASQVAVCLVLLSVVFGAGWHGSGGCASPSRHTTASVRLWCVARAVPSGLPGK